MAPSHALILAAGLGTRLQPLTLVRAKPAIPVAGVPLIRRIVSGLAQSGIRDLVVNLHHLPATLTRALGDGTDLGVQVRYSWEQPLVLGSAGGPRQALEIIGADTFFIVNGDTLAEVDFTALAEAHAASGALVTLALAPNRDPERYGGVQLEGSRVKGFVRRGADAAGSLHFVGIQVAHARAFEHVNPGRPTRSIGETYDALIAANPGAIRGFVSNGRFRDIGTVADYVETCRALSSGPEDLRGEAVRLDPTAHIGGTILWDDIEVAGGAVLDDCIVTDHVRVPAGASYRRAILRRGGSGDTIATPLEGRQ